MNSLNHPKVKPFTREVAASLEIEPAFVDFVFADNRPECFRYWVEDVNRGWTCYVPNEFDVAFPLWCTNADQTLMLANKSGLCFGRGSHDNPEVQPIAKTTQGLLTYLVNQIAESDATDDELRQAAEFCGYRHLEALLAFIDGPVPAGAAWHDAMNQLIADVDGMSR